MGALISSMLKGAFAGLGILSGRTAFRLLIDLLRDSWIALVILFFLLYVIFFDFFNSIICKYLFLFRFRKLINGLANGKYHIATDGYNDGTMSFKGGSGRIYVHMTAEHNDYELFITSLINRADEVQWKFDVNEDQQVMIDSIHHYLDNYVSQDNRQ